MSEQKISEPIGVQTADVIEWSKSLRSRSPSPTRHGTSSRDPSPGRHSKSLTRSRTPSPGRRSKSLQNTPRKGVLTMTDVPKPSSSRTPKISQTLKASTELRRSADSNLRKSTGNMSGFVDGKAIVWKSTGSSPNGTETGSIEAEYIKNLQQQIYFLELETNYLRQQARKATEMHPKMSAEAERMLSKLRQMQSEMDGMSLESKRKDSSISLLVKDKSKLEVRLKEEEDARARDKRMLRDEVIDLKKAITKIEAESSFKGSQLLEARNELDKSAAALKNAETKIISLKSQVLREVLKTEAKDSGFEHLLRDLANVTLEQRIEQHKMTQINLDEKRSELLSAETQLKSLEEKYYNSTINLQDKVTNDLREEIQILRRRQKEAELAAEQERHLRNKMGEDSATLVRENSLLNQQVIELTKQLERERNLRDEIESRHTGNISEMVQLKEKEKEAKFELDYIQEQLKKEMEKVKQYQEQASFKESMVTQHELQLNTVRSRVTELSGMHETMERENNQLRKDKSLLVDHVSDLQKKLELKNEEVVNLRSQIMSLEDHLREVEQIQTLEVTSQSAKWSEFEKLAESMRTLSHSMARSSTSPLGTRTSPRPVQF